MDPDKIATFVSVTSVNADRARAYLEATHGDLDAAVAMFYAEGESDEDATAVASHHHSVPPPPTSVPAPLPQAVARKPPAPQQPQSRFVTMDALRGRHGGGSGSDSEGEDEGKQAFYVGGSEHGGGQQVLGPPGSRKRPDADRIAHDLFTSARRHGATEVPPEELAHRGGGGGAAAFAAFAGRGRRLDQDPGTEASTAAAAHPVGGSHQQQATATVCRVLKLWSNGVSIDDGPLRSFEDPGTRELLRDVAQGHVPQELRADARGARVDLQLEDHRDVEYSPPAAPAFRAFAGSGLVLGSPVPAATVAAPVAPAAAASSASAVAGPAAGHAAVPVDSAQPTTNLNVRLPSGGRPLSVTLNLTHTVADLRRYVCAERPELAAARFAFFTTFPTAEISDEALSLQAAGLINAAVLVRIK